MKFFRSKIWILLLVLTLALSLDACSYRPEPEKTESGQTVFRLGFSVSPDSLDPYTADMDEAAAAISLLYDTLFYADIEPMINNLNSIGEFATLFDAGKDLKDFTDTVEAIVDIALLSNIAGFILSIVGCFAPGKKIVYVERVKEVPSQQ